MLTIQSCGWKNSAVVHSLSIVLLFFDTFLLLCFFLFYFCVFISGCFSVLSVWQMGCHLVEGDDEKDLHGLSSAFSAVPPKLYSANFKARPSLTGTSVTRLHDQTGFYFAFPISSHALPSLSRDISPTPHFRLIRLEISF